MTPERFAKYQRVLAYRQLDLSIVTDQVNKGQNIAALLRTCDAVGIHEIHAVTPKEGYRDHGGTARGSHQWVAVKQHDVIDLALNTVKAKGWQLVAAHFSDTAIDYRTIDYTQPTAIIMGAEMHGVSDEAVAAADHHIVIPIMGMTHSFNVSVAAAIILSEAQQQRQAKGMYQSQQLSAQEYQATLFRWCHPSIADYCQRHGLNYPAMDEQGDIIDLPTWYTEVHYSS